MFQYTPSETQQTRMRTPAGIEAMLSRSKSHGNFEIKRRGAPERSSDLNGQGRLPLQAEEGLTSYNLVRATREQNI